MAFPPRPSPAPVLPGGTVLPAALRHALGAFPEPVAARAGDVVRSLLAERTAAGSPDPWGGSRLTGDGFPVEIAFTTTDDRLRLTVEPGRRDLAPADRLALAADRIADAGPPVPPGVRSALAGMQASGPVRYGAWVSARVGEDGTGLKLYAEVPDPRLRWPGHPAPEPEEREPALRMVACTPATGVVESYLRIPSACPHHLVAVLAPAGAGDRADELAEWVETLSGRPARGRLPGPSVGVSYACGAGRTRVTLHLYARALWGQDRRIRERFAGLLESAGRDPGPYLAVTAPIADATGWRTRHGLVGITLEDGATPSVTIGVRPVAP